MVQNTAAQIKHTFSLHSSCFIGRCNLRQELSVCLPGEGLEWLGLNVRRQNILGTNYIETNWIMVIREENKYHYSNAVLYSDYTPSGASKYGTCYMLLAPLGVVGALDHTDGVYTPLLLHVAHVCMYCQVQYRGGQHATCFTFAGTTGRSREFGTKLTPPITNLT